MSTPVRFTYGYAEGRGAAGEEATELKRQLEASGLFKVDIKGYEWTDFQKRYAEGRLDAGRSAGSPTSPTRTPSAPRSSAPATA